MELNEYLQEMKKTKLLDLMEEKKLWERYKDNNDWRARQRLIESYQPLVFKVVMQLKCQADYAMDSLQEGTVGLIEAVESYDYTRNVAFSLYAIHRIRGRILNFLKREVYADLTQPDSQLYNEEDSALAVSVQVENQFLHEQLHQAMQRLPNKEQVVIDSVYMKDQEPKEVAESMALSTTHIYRLQKQGIKRIRGMMSKLMQHW